MTAEGGHFPFTLRGLFGVIYILSFEEIKIDTTVFGLLRF